jgi:two-component system, OmpR family, response regulator
MRLLLVEDDVELAKRMVGRLSDGGFVVESAEDAETALDWPEPDKFAAMVVDVGLPGLNGMELVSRWRAMGRGTPILMLTARGSWQEKVAGLNAGADDYVVKPVHPEEIIARVRALLRRTAGKASSRISAGEVELDPHSKTAWVADREIILTNIEFRLLQLFLLRPGHILAQSDILDHLYPLDKDREQNTIEVHVGRLRRKIGKDKIRTLRGLGYRFAA